MFQSNAAVLQSYATRVPCFSPADYQIICINNSSAPYSPDRPAWQGTLHKATILTPDESKRRIVNSTLIAAAPASTPDTLSASELQEFIQTAVVRRRGYDKQHLEDDR
jgi:hypothetical protein